MMTLHKSGSQYLRDQILAKKSLLMVLLNYECLV